MARLPSTSGFVGLEDLWNCGQHFEDREIIWRELEPLKNCEPDSFGYYYAKLLQARLAVIECQMALLPYALAFLSWEGSDVKAQ